MRAERAERGVADLQAAQSSWEQQLTHKDAATAEQVFIPSHMPALTLLFIWGGCLCSHTPAAIQHAQISLCQTEMLVYVVIELLHVQVAVLKMQLAAKEAALAQLEMLAVTAAESAEQLSALRTELARKTHQLADQAHQLAHLHDKVGGTSVLHVNDDEYWCPAE